jgi:hypothetical protein
MRAILRREVQQKASTSKLFSTEIHHKIYKFILRQWINQNDKKPSMDLSDESNQENGDEEREYRHFSIVCEATCIAPYILLWPPTTMLLDCAPGAGLGRGGGETV